MEVHGWLQQQSSRVRFTSRVRSRAAPQSHEALLDFFGAPVKAQELLQLVASFRYLGKKASCLIYLTNPVDSSTRGPQKRRRSTSSAASWRPSLLRAHPR
jgi:hypothetical protein